MATTNNIGLYCFNTGEEDAKTSLEALFGAGNSNMKKIDDAIGELRKKSFIVNTEAELNALLTEENLGKTVSYNGELYIIAEGGGNAPIEVGDTLDDIYFNTNLSTAEVDTILDKIDWSNPDEDMGADVGGVFCYYYALNGALQLGKIDADLDGEQFKGYYIGDSGQPCYASNANVAMVLGGTVAGWDESKIAEWKSHRLPMTVESVNDQQDIWGTLISKEPFTSGGIIAKPVGAEGGGLPSFAPEDAGKFLRVDSNGNIVAEAIAYAEGESF